jgi:hypothetical protein
MHANPARQGRTRTHARSRGRGARRRGNSPDTASRSSTVANTCASVIMRGQVQQRGRRTGRQRDPGAARLQASADRGAVSRAARATEAGRWTPRRRANGTRARPRTVHVHRGGPMPAQARPHGVLSAARPRRTRRFPRCCFLSARSGHTPVEHSTVEQPRQLPKTLAV